MRPSPHRTVHGALLPSTSRVRQRRSAGFPSSLSVVAIGLLLPHCEGPVYGITQRRGITQNHIRKTKEAKDQWDQWAKEIKAGERQSFVSKLQERGLIQDVVGGDITKLDKLITEKRVGLYSGFDPTAPSLHLGHLIPLMILTWAYLHGLKSVFLVGGTTSKIGDPTGRTESRPVMESAVRKANIASMHMQLKKFGASMEKFGEGFGFQWEWAWRRVLDNNNIWYNKLPLVDVLTTMASHARLGSMLGRDNVKSRMDGGEGMSLAEFCYPLMQAWDFWHLFQKGAQIQIGGSDQYGNILFGCDMIKQILKNNPQSEFAPKNGEDPDLVKPLGITTPLLTTSTGEKFGKSAGNAVWLDADMTPPYELYQYFMRLPDADMERYLKLFTLHPIPEVQTIMETHNENPSDRVAQHKLARNVVKLIHGPMVADQVERQHRLLFAPQTVDGELPIPEPGQSKTGAWNRVADKTAPPTNFWTQMSSHLTLPRSLVQDQFFHKVLYSAGLVSSKAEGFRVIVKGGAHVGCQADATQMMTDALAYTPIKTWPANVTQNFIIDGSLMILKVGKWKVKVIRIISDEEFEAEGLTAPGWKEDGGPDERREDKELFDKKQKLRGHWVKKPGISGAPQNKPKIVSLSVGEDGNPVRSPQKSYSKSNNNTRTVSHSPSTDQTSNEGETGGR